MRARIISVLLFFSGAAQADDFKECQSAPNREAQVHACTRLIDKHTGTTRVWPLYKRCIAYRRLKRFDEAVADCTEVLRLDPKHAQAYSSRAWAYVLKRKYDLAIADLDEAIRLRPNYVTAFNRRGIAYRRKGDYDRAIADYSEAIRLRPDYATAYNNRGYAYRKKGEYERAVTDYTEAIRLGSTSAAIFRGRASAYEGMGAYELAIADYDQAIRLDPKHAQAYSSRAWAYVLKRKYDLAIADLDEAIRLRPNYATAYNNRGYVYRKKGEYERAITDYTEAIRLGSTSAAIFRGRAAAYEGMGAYELAIADYDHAIRLNPRDATTFSNRAAAHVRMGQIEQAITDYTNAIRLKPDYFVPHAHRCYAHVVTADYGSAIHDCTRAIALNPKSSLAYQSRAWAFILTGQWKKAFADINAAAARLTTSDYFDAKAAGRNLLVSISLAAVLVLALLFGPVIIAMVAIYRVRRADGGLKSLSSKMDGLTTRVSQLERTLSERLPTKTTGVSQSEPVRHEVLAPESGKPPRKTAGAEEKKEPALAPIVPTKPPAKYEPAPASRPSAPPQPEEPIGEISDVAKQAAGPSQSLPPSATPQLSTASEAQIDRGRSLEEMITANWLVWVGGVAVALAGIFLVRYAAEQGWLSPAARCIIGVGFGVGLVIAAEVIRRRPLERAIAAIRPDYVPQALTAAGLVIAFGSVYLAYAFYALLPAAASFSLLAIIAFAGFALSLAQGPFVAALGLAGATVTPALVSTDNPTAWGFFSYLGVIGLAAMAVADRRRWWWLVLAALLAYFAWSLLWFVKLFAVDDIVPIGTLTGIEAFASLVLANRALRNGKEPRTHDQFCLNANMVAWTGLAIAVATTFLLAIKSEFAAAAHWMALAAAVGAAAIARFEPRFDLVLPAICVIVAAAFGLNYLDGIAIDNLAERAFGWPPTTSYAFERYLSFKLHAPLMAIALFAGGIASLSSARRPGLNSISTAAVPLLLLAIGYAEFRNITGEKVWAVPALSILIASWFAFIIVRRTFQSALFVQGVYVTVAVAASILALTFIFDRVWLTLAYALLLVALGIISTRIDLEILRRLANIIALLVIARLTVNPDLRGYELLHPLGMQWITYGYLLPIAAFLLAAQLFKRSRDDLLVSILEGGALLFAVLLVSIEIRIFMTGSIYSGAYKLPEMSLQTIAWLTSALILSIRHGQHPRPFSLWGARILTLAGSAQALLLQLIVHNPVFTGEVIQGYGLFNLLVLSLLAPAVLLWLIASHFGPIAPLADHQKPNPTIIFLRSLSMLLAFAFVTEEVRVFFQGMVIRPKHASLLELYVTTLVWLMPAIIPFTVQKFERAEGIQWAAFALAAVSAVMVLLGHCWSFNPALTGEPVRGWPVINTLLIGFFLPAAVFLWLSTRAEKRFGSILTSLCYFLLFVGLWLVVKQGFEGERLVPMHKSLLELYTTTVVWLALAALTLFIPAVRALEGAESAGHAVLGASLFMLFFGHSTIFNPMFDGSVVRGWPVFNTLLMGFIAPAIMLAVMTLAVRPSLRVWIAGAAYLLLFFGITLLVKHTFQGAQLVPEILSQRESYTYSAAWVVLGAATIIVGIRRDHAQARYAALVILLLAVLKVFLFDMSELRGLWRVASFLGLGLSLIGIGWIYQRFVYRKSHDAKAQSGAL